MVFANSCITMRGKSIHTAITSKTQQSRLEIDLCSCSTIMANVSTDHCSISPFIISCSSFQLYCLHGLCLCYFIFIYSAIFAASMTLNFQFSSFTLADSSNNNGSTRLKWGNISRFIRGATVIYHLSSQNDLYRFVCVIHRSDTMV